MSDALARRASARAELAFCAACHFWSINGGGGGKRSDGGGLRGNGGGGATGGGSDEVFYENDQAVTTDYTITASHNAMSAGPITVNNGITVTVPSGVRWVVL